MVRAADPETAVSTGANSYADVGYWTQSGPAGGADDVRSWWQRGLRVWSRRGLKRTSTSYDLRNGSLNGTTRPGLAKNVDTKHRP